MKTRRPPKKIKHAELWWHINASTPVIIYPDGRYALFCKVLYFWDTTEGNDPRLPRPYLEFVTELK